MKSLYNVKILIKSILLVAMNQHFKDDFLINLFLKFYTLKLQVFSNNSL